MRRRLTLMADEDLMSLVQAGDAAAFEVVYDRHADPVYSLAYRMLGARAAAEDVVQEAFTAVWRKSHGYRSTRGSVRNWLFGIVHHRAVDALRRSGAHSSRRAGDETAAQNLAADELTEVEVLRRSEASAVRGAVDRLPTDQLRVIELAYFGGFTHVEIADVLEIPLGTVKGRMRLGLDKLRQNLLEVA